MNKSLISLIILISAALVTTGEAWAARRLGGGQSVGQQREIVMPRSPAPAPTAPGNAAAPRPAPSTAAAPTAPPAPRPGIGRWLGPLAGLAAGIGLASLFGHEMGGILSGVLMVLLAVVAVTLLLRLMRRAAPPAVAGGGTWPAMGAETDVAPPPSQVMTQPVEPVGVTAGAARIPAGFDKPGFERQARQNFVALYDAYDRGQLPILRELTTDGMYAELQREITARGSVEQRVDITALDAELLEVVTEGRLHWASIRFSGMLAEDVGLPPGPFNEVWNLSKPADGSSGWLLAGIQQVN